MSGFTFKFNSYAQVLSNSSNVNWSNFCAKFDSYLRVIDTSIDICVVMATVARIFVNKFLFIF
jgi:hypothetical protein